jgi:acyl carrier protein
LTASGVNVRVALADIADPVALRRILNESLASGLPPLAGIVHAAGFLSDGALLTQSQERFMSVFGPKVDGSWHLHELSLDQKLDFFVLYSSFAALIGPPAQANHVAANAFMDALAAYRQQAGLPATTINWGMWGEIGSATAKSLHERATLLGIDPIPTATGRAVLAAIFEQLPGQIAICPIDWPKFLGQFHREADRRYYHHFKSDSASSSAPARRSDILEQLGRLPDSQKKEAVIVYLRQQIREVLGFAARTSIEADKRLVELGMDSLMALELKRRLEGDLKMTFPATMIFEYPTLEAMAGHIVPASPVQAAPQPQASAVADERKRAEIAKLSTAEAEQALLAELENLDKELLS